MLDQGREGGRLGVLDERGGVVTNVGLDGFVTHAQITRWWVCWRWATSASRLRDSSAFLLNLRERLHSLWFPGVQSESTWDWYAKSDGSGLQRAPHSPVPRTHRCRLGGAQKELRTDRGLAGREWYPLPLGGSQQSRGRALNASGCPTATM